MDKPLNPEVIRGILTLREQFLETDMKLGEAIHQMQRGERCDDAELTEFLREECLLAILSQNKAYNRYINEILACIGSPWCQNLFPLEFDKRDDHEDLDSRR